MEYNLRAYKKTVSIVDETAVQLYEGLVGEDIGFLLESYDKNNGRYSFFGNAPEAIIRSKGDCLVIKYKNGPQEVLQGKAVYKRQG